MIMGMAKTVFKDIPFFGNFLDGIDSILDLTGATKNLTEIVIPKTYKNKKVTTLGTDNLDVFIRAGKPQFELVLNENISEIKSCAFNKIGVTKVSGDTSGLCKIGEYAFSWVNKAGGYALNIIFAYPGVITTGDAIFNHVNTTLRLGHGTTFINTDFRASSVNYIFDDAHTYAEPVWSWTGDLVRATATFTCTDPRCANSVTVDAEVKVARVGDNAEGTAEVAFNGMKYTDTIVKPWADISRKGDDIYEEKDSGSETVPPVTPAPDNITETGDSASSAAVTAILLTSLTAVLFLAYWRRKDEEV